MSDSGPARSRVSLWVHWVAATSLGWVAGVFVAIVLSDLVVNLFYHEETNLIVGLCMGACMGLFQIRAIRRWFELARSWVVGGVLMVGPPFVAFVLFDELSLDLAEAGVRLVFGLIVLAGGLGGAWLQARALRPHTSRWGWWSVAMAASWGLTLAVTGLVGFMASGVVLGAVGGGFLLLLLGRPVTPQPGGSAAEA